jgi:hypothetical protein
VGVGDRLRPEGSASAATAALAPKEAGAVEAVEAAGQNSADVRDIDLTPRRCDGIDP